jgi:hypothetical protein
MLTTATTAMSKIVKKPHQQVPSVAAWPDPNTAAFPCEQASQLLSGKGEMGI